MTQNLFHDVTPTMRSEGRRPASRHSPAKWWFSLSFMLVFLGLGGAFFLRHRREFLLVVDFSPGLLIPLVALTLVTLALQGLRTQAQGAFFALGFGFRESLALTVTTVLGNHLFPLRPGLALKAYYFRRSKSLDYARFTALHAASYLAALMAAGLAGAAAAFVLGPSSAASLTMMAFAFLFLASAVLLAAGKLPKALARPSSFLMTAAEGWLAVRSSPRRLLILVGIELLILLTVAVRLQLCYATFTAGASFPFCLLVAALVSLSIFLALTPGNLGVREAIISFSSSLFGPGLEAGVLVSGADRVLLVGVMLLLQPLAAIWLTNSWSGGSSPPQAKTPGEPCTTHQE